MYPDPDRSASGTAPSAGSLGGSSAARVRDNPRDPWRSRIVGYGAEDPRALVPNPRNWRRHPTDQQRALGAAIDAIGFVAAPTKNVRTGNLVDGHLRVELAIARGEESVPVIYVDLSPEDEALVLASLDPLGAMATADAARLEALLAELTVDDAALGAMLAELAAANGIRRACLTDPDEIPPLPDPAELYVHPGDLWILGRHGLLVGDSTDQGNIARLVEAMGGKLADGLWTDPPYGVEYEGKTAARLRIDNDVPAASEAALLGALRAAPMGPSAPFYVCGSPGPRHLAFHAAIAEAGRRVRQELVWFKGAFVLGHSDYHYAHEPLLYGHAPGPGRPGRGRHSGSRWFGDNAQSSVLHYPKPASNPDHPTAKPTALVERCLRNSTRPGDVVFDPFTGSGGTLLAAERLGLRFAGLEIAARYAQVAIERWQAYSGERAVRHG